MSERTKGDLVIETKLFLEEQKQLESTLKGKPVILPVPYEGQDFKTRATYLLTRLAAELARAREWIPCAERLPDKHGRYYVAYANPDDWPVDIATYDAGWHTCEGDEVSHWMPLPEPPAKEADDAK